MDGKSETALEATGSRDHHRVMLLHVGTIVGKSYLLLLTVAAGGLVGANIAGFVPAVLEFASNNQRAPDPEFARMWMNGGWIVGAGLFFGGAVGRTFRSIRKDIRTAKRHAEVEERSRGAESRANSEGFRVEFGSRQCGVPGSVAVGGVMGGFMGLMLGGSFLLLWFSAVYSPFRPDHWATSISVERVGLESDRNWALTTDHPVAISLFCVPIALGAVAGAVVCGVGTAVEQTKTRSERQSVDGRMGNNVGTARSSSKDAASRSIHATGRLPR